jgi:hypothetical protein
LNIFILLLTSCETRGGEGGDETDGARSPLLVVVMRAGVGSGKRDFGVGVGAGCGCAHFEPSLPSNASMIFSAFS